MKLGVPKETVDGETRVALTADIVSKLVKKDFEVLVEAGAGERASFPDAAYEEVGAAIVDGDACFGDADLVLKVQAPSLAEVERLREGAALISFLYPLISRELVEALAARKVTALAMDQVPRITRAQSMDALSSQSTVAGYKAVLLAACASPKFFPMLTTAAGTIPPAKVVVLGAGVAGLQAIATAKRLGAVVKAYDIRAATKEQVESLGASFIDMPEFGEADAETAGGYAKELDEERQAKEREVLAKHLGQSDVVITTALIPGRPAPLLVTEEMVEAMRPGSLILDMAAETGGNCALSEAGEDVVHGGVRIMGPVNLPASLPEHSSRMYARNISDLLRLLAPEAELLLDFEDEIVRGACITHEGEVIHEATRASWE